MVLPRRHSPHKAIFIARLNLLGSLLTPSGGKLPPPRCRDGGLAGLRRRCYGLVGPDLPPAARAATGPGLFIRATALCGTNFPSASAWLVECGGRLTRPKKR